MKLSEDEIRRITLTAINEMGDDATPELVKKAVSRAVSKLDTQPDFSKSTSSNQGRLILTSFGLNQTGVVAKITTELSECGCDLQDISQKLMDDFYTLIVIVDISGSSKNMSEIQEKMNKIAEALKIKIYLQHEEIFRQMHRI
ncbi:MAG: ACT domain-containing protein [Bacteroidetes bacterium]|nr:ACT domain-containing protein [Bacteroidota bacterium]